MPRATDRRDEWLRPPAEQEGLKQYLQTLRERFWLVVLAVILTTGGAVAYVFTAEEVYETDATILVSPVSGDGETLPRLGLVRESSDPLRVIETVAELVKSRGAANLTAERLGGLDADKVLRSIRVEPLAESNLLVVIAEASEAKRAAELANTFTRSAIDHRTGIMHERIDAALPQLQARVDQLGGGAEKDLLSAELVELEALRAGQDPTISFEARANAPDNPVSPRKRASIAAGLIAGLVLGIGGAFALQVLDPKLRREEQLRGRYALPILARIPRESGVGASPLPWTSLSAGSIEGYRTLRSVLMRAPGTSDGTGAIMVTSSGPSEGKTTTAINLATSLALSGRRVILVEADLRRPTIGETLGVVPDRGIVAALTGEATVEESLIAPPYFADNLKLLLAETTGAELGDLFAPTAERLLADARALTEYVVVDSPPLATVVDALPLAGVVDHVLLAAKVGRTNLRRLQELAELLADSGIRPVGFALVSSPRTGKGYYSDYGYRAAAMAETSGSETS